MGERKGLSTARKTRGLCAWKREGRTGGENEVVIEFCLLRYCVQGSVTVCVNKSLYINRNQVKIIRTGLEGYKPQLPLIQLGLSSLRNQFSF